VRMKAAAVLLVLLAAAAGPVPSPSAQTSQPGPPSARAADRIAALHRESEMLARQERSLLGDLRKLEIERDLRIEDAKKLDAEVEAVGRQIEETTRQAQAIEQQIEAARPALNARLVEAYKLGRPGYARLLLDVRDLREAGRTVRMVAARAHIDQQRVQEFTASVAQLSAARAALGDQANRLQRLQAQARASADLAAKAAAARAALVHQIDERRDLNAQMAGELEAAARKLQQTIQALPGTPADQVLLPIKPFQGVLDWPVQGRVTSRLSAGPGSPAVRNGVEIESAEGRAVRAIHDGRVAFADVFPGLGQLVIVDHGGMAFSLYGYLGSIAVARGASVGAGQALGTAGRAAAGNSAVYFELRIDGKPVNPLQWLRAGR
jgi:murein hydrolase activator